MEDAAISPHDSDRPPAHAEPTPFEPGTVLEGRYRIDTEVGRGGMGVVYRGTDLTLNRPVAIKAMLASSADAELVSRFMREARSLARVEHRGLVPVYAVGREGPSYYMVMKFIEGESLSAKLKRHPVMPHEEVRELIVQVSSALGALHRAGLIHRDMKPGNLMVGSDGRITVMDLGIVKSVGENTQTTSTALGTPRYMAPEMLSEANIDGRADMYSLAVIAYQALAGEPPFDGPTPMAILYKQAHEAPETLRKVAPDVPRNLAAAIERALAKDPEDRFSNAEAFAQAVHVDAVAPRGSGAAMKATLAVFVLALAGLGAWVALRGPDDPEPKADQGVAAVTVVEDAAPPPPVDAAPPPPKDAAPPPKDAAPPPKDAAPKKVVAPVKWVKIKVSSSPRGALVMEGGRRLGRTPLELRRRQSKRKLRLSFQREGYGKKTRSVDLSKDGSVRVKLEAIFELVP